MHSMCILTLKLPRLNHWFCITDPLYFAKPSGPSCLTKKDLHLQNDPQLDSGKVPENVTIQEETVVHLVLFSLYWHLCKCHQASQVMWPPWNSLSWCGTIWSGKASHGVVQFGPASAPRARYPPLGRPSPPGKVRHAGPGGARSDQPNWTNLPSLDT